MMICNAKWQPLNEEAKSGFTFGCCIRGLPTSSWYVRLWEVQIQRYQWSHEKDLCPPKVKKKVEILIP